MATIIDRLVTGLSPRERGNHRRLRERVCAVGSIPARAGEPRADGRATRSRRVYPRASGGTTIASVASTRRAGLSPRERGNQADDLPF